MHTSQQKKVYLVSKPHSFTPEKLCGFLRYNFYGGGRFIQIDPPHLYMGLLMARGRHTVVIENVYLRIRAGTGSDC